MPFFSIKTILLFLAIAGAGAGVGIKNSVADSNALNPTTIVIIIVGLLVAFFVMKYIWKMLGCLFSAVLFALIAGGVIFVISGSGFDISKVTDMLGSSETAEEKDTDETSEQQETDKETDKETPPDEVQLQINELQKRLENLQNQHDVQAFKPETSNQDENTAPSLVMLPSNRPAPQQPRPIVQKTKASVNLIDKFETAFSSLLEEEQKKSQQLAPQQTAPRPPPVIKGRATVVNGDTLKINGRRVRLFGIEAPDMDQLCASKTGASYRCGQIATRNLKKIIGNSVLECKIKEQDAEGNVIAACSNGQYDLGVAMVASGWAVAYRKFSQIYVPYENQAQAKKAGLWAGRFYMPWDWRASQKKRQRSMRGSSRKKGGGLLGGMLD
ncbi:MAG: thermonuclease family protein [Alphaproteobacteria bacterium]|nr:thermonuclease family protein [Alphaproteobacteria bacterium]